MQWITIGIEHTTTMRIEFESSFQTQKRSSNPGNGGKQVRVQIEMVLEQKEIIETFVRVLFNFRSIAWIISTARTERLDTGQGM